MAIDRAVSQTAVKAWDKGWTTSESRANSKGSPATIRCTRTVEKVWKNYAPETDARCQLRRVLF